MIQAESAIAATLTRQAEKEAIVCHHNLRPGITTIGAFVNIDVNLSSTTSQSSFHGTEISITQFQKLIISAKSNLCVRCLLSAIQKRHLYHQRTPSCLPPTYTVVSTTNVHRRVYHQRTPSCLPPTYTVVSTTNVHRRVYHQRTPSCLPPTYTVVSTTNVHRRVYHQRTPSCLPPTYTVVSTTNVHRRVYHQRTPSCLPPTYIVVQALAVNISESTVPAPPASKVQLSDNLDKAVTEETKWTEKVSALLGKASRTLKDAVSRATHRAAQNRARTEVEAISAMLTLFAEKSDSPAIVKHAMEVVITVT